MKDEFFSIYRGAAIVDHDIKHDPVKPEDVTFYLFTKERPNDYTQITDSNVNLIAEPKRKIVFFIHGWINHRRIEWYEKLKYAFLNTHGNEYVVVQVDWEKPAFQKYYVASINTYDVGKYYSSLIYILGRKERNFSLH